MTDHIIVLPGGSYQGHAPHEAEPVAEWLGSLGIPASVLRYPVADTDPTPLHPHPLRAVRAEIAARRAAGATRVGLLGFSAGGHAAGFAALAPGDGPDGAVPPEQRADLALLGYPVVSMELPTHELSRHNLIGADASPELRAATSLDRLVTASAPPFFIWHTAEDAGVPVQHSYLLGQALAENGVPHELVVYPRGAHGLGLARGSGLPEGWTAAGAAWLGEQGWIA